MQGDHVNIKIGTEPPTGRGRRCALSSRNWNAMLCSPSKHIFQLNLSLICHLQGLLVLSNFQIAVNWAYSYISLWCLLLTCLRTSWALSTVRSIISKSNHVVMKIILIFNFFFLKNKQIYSLSYLFLSFNILYLSQTSKCFSHAVI